MSIEIIKKSFKEENEEIYIYTPILYRQIAIHFIHDEELNIFVDYSREMNDISKQEAYTKECLKECLKKYKNYKNYKNIFYSIKMFKRIIKNKLPTDIILEVVKYL